MYRFFINRPIVAMVIAILMVLVGLVSMTTLPISQFPSVVPPEIRIQTTFVGADAGFARAHHHGARLADALR